MTPTTLLNTGAPTKGKQPKEGDKVIIRATIENVGSADAAATVTAVTLDGTALPGSPVATAPLAAGASVEVDLDWDTRGVKGNHTITVTADAGGAVTESREGNNSSTLAVSVQGNKVANGDFEQSNAEGTGPEAWTGESTVRARPAGPRPAAPTAVTGPR